MLDFRQLQSVDGEEGLSECARRFPGRSNRVEDGDLGGAPDELVDVADKCPEA